MGLREVGLGECPVAAQHGQVRVPHELLQLEEGLPPPRRKFTAKVCRRVWGE